MMEHTDLVFPQGNEEHLVKMAKRLGVRHLILCYTLKNPLLKERKKEVAILAEKTLTTEFAIMVRDQNDISRAKSFSASIVAVGRHEMFEDKRVNYLIDFEMGRRDDFIHHRNSGLNQVFIAAAKRSDKTLLVNANNLLYGDDHAVTLGRIMQNNAFFKKYSPNVLVVSGAREPLQMRAPRDLRALLDL